MVRLVRRSLVVAAAFLAGAAAQGQTPVRQTLAVPDLPGFRTLKADFHLHTVFSDGNVWPTVHVQEAWRDGLDVIALTEHAEYHPHTADVKVDGGRSYAIAKPLADQLGVILVPGVEITKPDPPAPLVLAEGPQHFNALFVTDANALNVPNDLMEALRRAKAQQAFVFWNHPGYRVERPRWFAPVARAFDAGLFQGMELVNGPDFYDDAYPWIAERKLTILANSDAHNPLPPRAAGFRRPITLLFARTADLDGVRDALTARRTAAWLGDDVWGAEEHLRGIWNGAIVVETADGRKESDPARAEHVVDPDAHRRPARTGVVGLPGTDEDRRRTGHRAPSGYQCRDSRRRASSRARAGGVEPARRAGAEPDRHDAGDGAKVGTQLSV